MSTGGPSFFGSEVDILTAIVDYLHQRVRKELWSTERVAAEFGRRTCHEILRSGSTFAYAPCPERTLVATHIARAHGLEPKIVYHERRVYRFGLSTAHFAIEVVTSEGPWMFDFGTWETRLVAGGYYYSQEWEETLNIARLPAADVDPYETTMESLSMALVSEKLDFRQKLEWYRDQLEKPRPGITEDRVIFAKEYSLVEAI